MAIWSDRLVAFSQKYPLLTSGLLGLIAALGFPPIHAWYLALPSLALFVLLLRTATGWRSAFGRGWVFGWAHLTLANNWIATAFTFQAQMPEFLGWLAVPLLCIYLAIYPALAALFAHLAGRKLPLWAFGFLLAAAWIITEWLRSWVFTGYPWPPLGLMLLGGWETPGIAMLLPWMGTYALSGLAVLLAGAIAWGIIERQRIYLGLIGLVLVAGMIFYQPSPSRESDVTFALVQPNLQQDEINDASKFEEQFERIANLTLDGRFEERLVLWPESALPDFLEDGYPQRYYDRMTAEADPAFARRRIGAVIGEDSTLLLGITNLDIEGSAGLERAVTARNSVMAINGAGDITQGYAKAHLVPYGEYLPMRGLLEPLGLSRLVAGSIDFVPGPGPRTLDLSQHGKAGIQICYEIVFSGQVVDRGNRPDYIFNPSNDGWFGLWGPPQHLAQARLRAIEEGLPVLRSTTTGISAVIDANGRVLQSIGRNKADRIDGNVPAAKVPTLFSQMGNALPLVWAGLLIILAIGLPRLVASRSKRG